MMPLNQQVASTNAYHQIMDYLSSKDPTEQYINRKNKELTSKAYNTLFFTRAGISKGYAEFLRDYFFVIQQELASSPQPLNNYFISYSSLRLSPQVIGGRIFCTNGIYHTPKYAFLKINTKEGVGIYGIQNNDPSDPNYLGPKLYLTNSSSDKPANELLFNNSTTNDSVYNVIINHAMALKNSLRVGSIFQLHAINSFSRMTEKINGDLRPVKINLRVVGISRGSKDPRAYISYDNSNQILGKNEKTKNNDGSHYCFNGFYAPSTDKMRFLNNSISSFSPSGLYPATQDFDHGFRNLLSTAIKQGKDLYVIINALQEEPLDSNKDNDYVQKLKKYYGVPFILIWKDISSTANDFRAFDTVSRVTITLLVFSISIIFVMGFFITVLISILSMNSLSNVGVHLRVFGYSCRQILFSMLSIYLPAFLIGTAVSCPITVIVGSVFCK
ncbi:hypothetical protein DICVIV_13698 [Dictyocaulus viviparus]|uniref:Uncharacterized protein n=1 Tax=Dictyocaulus viviparus TaxID=29172 RepID=A0A0D8X9B9_DICVI|nr:hypothetical protein DICVIV_13698 [Dictyocaulus viviparus]